MEEVKREYKKEADFIKEDYDLINVHRNITGIYNYSDEYYYNHFIL